MTTINEDYVSYETAKLLKEKGFNEEVLAVYIYDNLFVKGENNIVNPANVPIILAPTHQMAMKWLMEKHVVIVVTPKSFCADGSCGSWAYSIWADDNLEVDGEEEWEDLYESYEEAVEAALKYSLKNLI